MKILDSNPDRALKRLMAEYKMLQRDKEDWFEVHPKDGTVSGRPNDNYRWEIEIYGFEGSLYAGYLLRAEMLFPHDYPIAPPKMRFINPMFHPNIYEDGSVCISILHTSTEPFQMEPANEQWSPVQSTRTILLSVLVLLNEPYLDSPANVDAAKCYRASKEEYEKKVKILLEKGCDRAPFIPGDPQKMAVDTEKVSSEKLPEKVPEKVASPGPKYNPAAGA